MNEEDIPIGIGVEVVGAAQAVAALDQVTAATGSVSTELRALVAASEAVEGGLSGMSGGLTAAQARVEAFDASVRSLQQSYRQIAAANPGGGSQAWLATFGIDNVEKLRQAQAVLAADAVRDYDQMQAAAQAASRNAIQAEQQRMNAERQASDEYVAWWSRSLSEIEQRRAQSDTARSSGFAAVQAQQNENLLATMTPLEASEARLAQATENLTRAQQEAASAGGSYAAAVKNYGAASEQATTAGVRSGQALENLARAMGQLRTAGVAYADALNQASSGTNNFTRSAQSLQYAMFYTSFTLSQVGNVGKTFLVDAIKQTIDFQSAFAEVARTVSGYSDSTRQQIESLSQELPVTIDQLAQTATLGGQLGQGSASISQFVEVVSKLTATTNLTSDAAGTLLGRMQALLGVSPDNFQNVGAAVLSVGANSVATESQIAGLATQIAGLGKNLGLSAQDIIGWSGALASVGVNAELGRSSLQRIFNELNSDAGAGGAKLQALGDIAGTTGAAFKQRLGTDASGALLSLVNGLAALSAQGEDTTQVLNAIGITNVRDVYTLQQLAASNQNVAQSLALANDAWNNAAATMDRYFGPISATTASRIQYLQSAWQQLLDTIGKSESGPVNGVIQALTGIVNFADDLLRINPILSGLIVGVVGVGTALLLLLAGLARVASSFFNLQFVVSAVGNEFPRLSTFIKAFTGVQTASTTATKAATAAQTALGISVDATTGQFRFASGAATAEAAALDANAAAARGATAAQDGAATAARGLRIALASTGIGLAVALIGSLVASMIELNSATSRESQYWDSIDFSDAIKQDTAAFQAGKGAISTWTSTAGVASSQQDTFSQTGANMAKVLGTDVKSSADAATSSIQGYTQALGDAVKAQVVQSLQNDPAFSDIFDPSKGGNENLAAWRKYGGDINNAISVGLKGGDKQAIFNSLVPSDLQQQIQQAYTKALSSGYSAIGIGTTGSAIIDPLRQIADLNASAFGDDASLIRYAQAANSVAGSLDAASGSAIKGANVAQVLAGATDSATNASGGLENQSYATANALSYVSQQVQDLASAMASSAGSYSSLGGVFDSIQTKAQAAGKAASGAAKSARDAAKTAASGPTVNGQPVDIYATNSSTDVIAHGIAASSSSGTGGSGGSASDLGKQIATEMMNSVETVLAQWQLNNATQIAFDNNLIAIGKNGGAALATALAEQGPEKAGAIAQQLVGNPELQREFEVQARISGLLANDSFMQGFLGGASDNGISDEVLKAMQSVGATLDDVMSAVEASSKGGDAWTQFVQGWNAAHADSPLDVGNFGISGTALQNIQQQIADAVTSNTITIPMAADQIALTEGFSNWKDLVEANPSLNTIDLSTTTDPSSLITKVQTALNNAKLNANVNTTITGVSDSGGILSKFLVNAWKGVPYKLPSNADGGFIDQFGVGHYAGGGSVGGIGGGRSDSNLAWLSKGEYVTPADATNYYGTAMMDAIRNKNFPTMGQLGSMLQAASASGPRAVTNVSVVQNYPQTVDPLKELQADSENLVAGIWG